MLVRSPCVVVGRRRPRHRHRAPALRAHEGLNSGELDVLVGQIAAMGVSLNLQHGGNRIIVVEEDWSPSVMDQFFARLHRIGQTEHVHVDILESDDKLSQAVRRTSNAKRAAHAVAMGNRA